MSQDKEFDTTAWLGVCIGVVVGRAGISSRAGARRPAMVLEGLIQSNKDDIVKKHKLRVEPICKMWQTSPNTSRAPMDPAPSGRTINHAVSFGGLYSPSRLHRAAQRSQKS